MRTTLFAVLFTILAVPAIAQTNPAKILFDHSDFPAIDSYEVGFFFEPAPTPHMVVPLAKTQITNVNSIVYNFDTPRPLFATGVSVRMRALYTTQSSSGPVPATTPWSTATIPFGLSPTTPVNPRLP